MFDNIKLYLIADFSKKTEKIFFERVEFYLSEGIRLFQLRAKRVGEKELPFLIERLKIISCKYNAFFIINDYWYFVNEFDLDGVHLGREDFPPEIFKMIASEKFVGYTVNNRDDLAYANKVKPDYIGVGPAFYTETKSKDKLTPILGPEGIKEIIESTFLPYYAIGGINGENIPILIEEGILRFAISSYLMQADEPRKVVKTLREFSLI